MATITTRAGKGSALTWAEVDANFTGLNTDKLEATDLSAVAISGAYSDLTGVPATFAPSSHTHAISDVTGLQTALDGKQAAGNYQPLATVLTNTTASFTTALETKLNGLSNYTDVQARAAVNIAPTTQSGTSYTAVLGDAAGYIQFTNGSAVAFTIPPNASVAFATGTVITIEQNGAGTVTLTPGAGVTLNSRGGLLATAGQYSVVQVKKVATNIWTVIGDVA